MRDGSSVASVEDGGLLCRRISTRGIQLVSCNPYRKARQCTRPDLPLLGERLVVRPIHDARGQRIARDVLHTASHSERTSRWREERVRASVTGSHAPKNTLGGRKHGRQGQGGLWLLLLLKGEVATVHGRGVKRTGKSRADVGVGGAGEIDGR